MRYEYYPVAPVRALCLIDGIRVSGKVWRRRQLFGEYAAARFDVVEY